MTFFTKPFTLRYKTRKTRKLDAKNAKDEKMVKDLLYKKLVYKIQGVVFEVYKELGPGFKESIYQQALEEEFNHQRIPFQKEVPLEISYKDKKVGLYRPDFIVDEKVILEVKAVPQMPLYFETQLYYYLKATNYKLGLLVNFGCDGGVDIRRRILTRKARKTDGTR